MNEEQTHGDDRQAAPAAHGDSAAASGAGEARAGDAGAASDQPGIDPAAAGGEAAGVVAGAVTSGTINTTIAWTAPSDWGQLLQQQNAFIAQQNANLQAQLATQALQQQGWHLYPAALLGAQWRTMEPDPPLEDAGITVGEIVAWRAWMIDCDGTLRSTATQTAWRPGEPMTGDLDVAGVHAWKTFDQARQYAMVGLSMIVGQVELWGAVVEHADGYRAEYAAPVSLEWPLNDDAHRAAYLAARRYNIPFNGPNVYPPTIVIDEPPSLWRRLFGAPRSGGAVES